MPATATADSLTFPKIIQPIEEVVTRRIVSEIDETGRGAGARPSPSRTIAGPHADDYYRNQGAPAPAGPGAHHHDAHGTAGHSASNNDNGPRRGGIVWFIAAIVLALVVTVGLLLAFTDKGKQVTALLLGEPQQEVQADPRDDGPAKYKPAVYSPDDRMIDRGDAPRRWSPPPQSRQERLPTPEEISRMVPHYISRTPAKCAPGYWQDDDGWCHSN